MQTMRRLILVLLFAAVASAQTALLTREPILLKRSPARDQTFQQRFAIPDQLSKINVTLERPKTTTTGIDWALGSKADIRLTLLIDGVVLEQQEFEGYGGSTRDLYPEDPTIDEKDYTAMWEPSWGFFHSGAETTTRIGERQREIKSDVVYELRVEMFWVSGTIDTNFSVSYLSEVAPAELPHNSVAFGAVSSAAESDQADNSVSVSHTSGSGSDIGVVILGGSVARFNSTTAASASFPGTTMVEEAFFGLSNTTMQSVHVGVGQTTGAQTASVTFTTDGDSQTVTIGVISVTGVDQTTPADTAVTTTDAGCGAISVDCSTAATDDLVIGHQFHDCTNVGSCGANETERFSVSDATYNVNYTGCTQAGSDGGVMSADPPGTAESDGQTLSCVNLNTASAGGRRRSHVSVTGDE